MSNVSIKEQRDHTHNVWSHNTKFNANYQKFRDDYEKVKNYLIMSDHENRSVNYLTEEQKILAFLTLYYFGKDQRKYVFQNSEMDIIQAQFFSFLNLNWSSQNRIHDYKKLLPSSVRNNFVINTKKKLIEKVNDALASKSNLLDNITDNQNHLNNQHINWNGNQDIYSCLDLTIDGLYEYILLQDQDYLHDKYFNLNIEMIFGISALIVALIPLISSMGLAGGGLALALEVAGISFDITLLLHSIYVFSENKSIHQKYGAQYGQIKKGVASHDQASTSALGEILNYARGVKNIWKILLQLKNVHKTIHFIKSANKHLNASYGDLIDVNGILSKMTNNILKKRSKDLIKDVLRENLLVNPPESTVGSRKYYKFLGGNLYDIIDAAETIKKNGPSVLNSINLLKASLGFLANLLSSNHSILNRRMKTLKQIRNQNKMSRNNNPFIGHIDHLDDCFRSVNNYQRKIKQLQNNVNNFQTLQKLEKIKTLNTSEQQSLMRLRQKNQYHAKNLERNKNKLLEKERKLKRLKKEILEKLENMNK